MGLLYREHIGKFVGEFAHASHCGVALVPMPSADGNEGEANELS